MEEYVLNSGVLEWVCKHVGLTDIVFLAFVIIYESFTFTDFADSSKYVKAFAFSGTSTTFTTAIFAYLSHPNVLDVFKVDKKLSKPSTF